MELGSARAMLPTLDNPDEDPEMNVPHFREAAQRLLANDPSLKTLTLATHAGVPMKVLLALAQNVHVHTAHFEMTKWDDEQCKRLCSSGSLHSSLKSLHLTRNQITSAGLPALSEILTRSQLTHLNLSCNPLGGDLAPLGCAVPRSRLQVLNLNDTLRSGDGNALVALVEALTQDANGSNRLRSLHLQNNGVDDEVAVRLSLPLAAAGIGEIHLSANLIGDVGGSALARAFSRANALEKLTLLNNKIGDAAAVSFGETIGANPSLQQLNLSHNRIGDIGLAALTRGVQSNTRLRTLDVSVNSMCSKDAKEALREAISRPQLQSRQHSEFRCVAHLLLLAHLREARGLEEDPLCKLPHGVLVMILALASPDGFPPLEAPVEGSMPSSMPSLS